MDSTIISALIGAAAAVGATILAHYLKQRTASSRQPKAPAWDTRDQSSISIQEARTRILEKASLLSITDLSVVQESSPSSFGTSAFFAHVGDGKGALYCHASGPRRGEVYYVRKGIGWYYNHQLQGSPSFLGLPLSDEEKLRDGSRRNLFEGGYIVWRPNDDALSVYDTRSSGAAKLVKRYQF